MLDIGGGGLIATKLANRLRRKGHEFVAASPNTGVNIRASDSFDKSGLELNRVGRVVVGPNLLAKEQSTFALDDFASLVPKGAERLLPSTAQVANQQAMQLISCLPAWLRNGEPVLPFRFRDLGSLVSLSDYNAFGTLARFGFFKGGFIKGRFAQLSHVLLYRRHQLSLHGTGRAVLLWLAERINALVQPDIRIS